MLVAAMPTLMTVATTITAMDYYVSPLTTITMPPSTKSDTMATTTARENTTILPQSMMATTMDYHLSPLTYHDHIAIHIVGHKAYHKQRMENTTISPSSMNR
jgi:hypothetical protein